MALTLVELLPAEPPRVPRQEGAGGKADVGGRRKGLPLYSRTYGHPSAGEAALGATEEQFCRLTAICLLPISQQGHSSRFRAPGAPGQTGTHGQGKCLHAESTAEKQRQKATTQGFRRMSQFSLRMKHVLWPQQEDTRKTK